MNLEQRALFGARLKMFRQLSNITQSDIVDAGAKRGIFFTRSQVSMIERGLRDLTFEIVLLLSLDFNCEVKWIMTGKPPMFAEKNKMPSREGKLALVALEKKISKNEAATQQLDKAIKEVKAKAATLDKPDAIITLPVKPFLA